MHPGVEHVPKYLCVSVQYNSIAVVPDVFKYERVSRVS